MKNFRRPRLEERVKIPLEQKVKKDNKNTTSEKQEKRRRKNQNS